MAHQSARAWRLGLLSIAGTGLFAATAGMASAQSCADPVTAGYGWEDGEGTTIGGTFPASVTVVNIDDFVLSGSHALRATESPHAAGTPQLWLAHIRNLSDGDVVEARFWTYDDTPGEVFEGWPSVRIWAHYTLGDSLTAVAQAGGNEQYSSGIGWEEMGHTWVFDSNEGQRDGLVIQARLYSATCNKEPCSTDYYFDDLFVSVCAANPKNVAITLPQPPPPPQTVLAYWDFNDETLDVSVGEGTMTHNFVPENVVFFLGTDVNALDPDASPNRAVALQNGSNGINNGASVEFALDTTGYQDLVMSFAIQRTSTGFDSNQVAYSADGGTTWVDFGSPFTPASSFQLTGVVTFDFTGVFTINNNPDTVVRITFDGGSTTAQSGNNRLDNVLFTAGEIESPACPADITEDNVVDIFDLLAVLAAWGPCADPEDCPADLTDDGVVDIFDLLAVLAAWGPCP